MKRNFIFCILVLILTAIVGCGTEEKVESEYSIYYLNRDKTKIIAVPYEPESETDTGLIIDMIQMLSEDPGSLEYRKPLGGAVEIISWSLGNRQLQLNFSSDYLQMDRISEVLCRAAVVRTLTQVPGVDSVSFYVADTPLMDQNGKPIGLMTAESFIENPGEQINSIQTATLTLYFSNPQGNGLVQEVQECHYNSNISLEKLIMERLMKEPIGENCKMAIPIGTKLVGVSVLDGVCFVNLSEGFMNQNYEIDGGVVIYSIVNSLVELPNINKVQISVNGDTSIVYREKYPLSTVFERNLDYMATVIEPVDEQEETEEEQKGVLGGQ